MENVWLITGLGNPGKQYDGTRHNVGFETLDELIDTWKIDGPMRFGKSMIGKGRIGSARVIAQKPMTYMNLSGEAVREVVDYYKIDYQTHLIVISDDIDLPEGQLRIRAKGSPGGHNGLKNIVQHLGDGNFIRIRVGVGAKPSPNADLANYVLGHPTGEDKKILVEAEKKAADAIACIIEQGVDKAMTLYNTKPEKTGKKKKERQEPEKQEPEKQDPENKVQETPDPEKPESGEKTGDTE